MCCDLRIYKSDWCMLNFSSSKTFSKSEDVTGLINSFIKHSEIYEIGNIGILSSYYNVHITHQKINFFNQTSRENLIKMYSISRIASLKYFHTARN